jgi:hypothetical protein
MYIYTYICVYICMDPECYPSQFSHQVSEMALVSALKALRFAQVVLIVIENKQGKFSKLDLQLARKCLDEVYMCICIDICIYLCIYIYVHIYMYIYTHIHTYV